jgi:hypothetical protein
LNKTAIKLRGYMDVFTGGNSDSSAGIKVLL